MKTTGMSYTVTGTPSDERPESCRGRCFQIRAVKFQLVRRRFQNLASPRANSITEVDLNGVPVLARGFREKIVDIPEV